VAVSLKITTAFWDMKQCIPMDGQGIARMGEKRNAYRVLMGKSKRNRLLGEPIHRWKDNIKTDLRERRWRAMDWIELAEDREQSRALVNTVMKWTRVKTDNPRTTVSQQVTQ
jgi:hypothetical protein